MSGQLDLAGTSRVPFTRLVPVELRQDVAWMVREGAPWVGRQARDLRPWAVRMASEETRPRRAEV